MNNTEKELRDTLVLNTPGEGSLNYSIKAGAGGGKTTLLSSRICKQIAAGTPIDEFVIITYTNAAAAELRDKISERLGKIAVSPAASEEERSNAANAMNSIELMQISTIHSFLLRILREHAFETCIALDARMLVDDEDMARKEKFFNKWYHEHFDEIHKHEWIHKLKDGTERDVTYEVFYNMFMDIADVREEVTYDLTDHTQDFHNAAVQYVTGRWLPRLSIFKNALLANRPMGKDKQPIDLNKDPQKIVDLIAEVEGKTTIGCDDAITLSQALKIINKFVKTGTSFYGKRYSDAALIGSIPQIPAFNLEWDFETLYNDFMCPSRKASEIADYVCNMRKAYQKENDAETMSLSNNDILCRADKLLSDHPEVLDKLREKYTKIYVDEFQDTTGVQARLVKMLSEKAGTDPAAEDLQEDKLIVVGDPKQSIYRFTGAEIAVYDEVDAMMAGKPDSLAESVSLDTNFRSNKNIVDWVNDKFSILMPSYLSMDTDWVVSEANALHGVYRYVADLGVDEKGKEKKYKKDEDAKAVVELVKKLVDNEHCFIENPNRTGLNTFGTPVLSKIGYADIMIICKNTSNIKKYVEEFAKYGIPVNVQGKFIVSEDKILRNFVLLVEYLAGYKNKKKRITAAQILAGLDASKVDESELKKTEDELNDLRTFFRENGMDSAAIVRYLLSKEELFLPKGEEQDVRRVREYRIRLNQMVETCLSNNDGDFSKLSSLMNAYIEKEIKREIPLDSNEHAVKLMNVHQAKGLTGKVVIIADRSNEEKCRYGGFKNAGKYYPVVSYKLNVVGASSTIIAPSFGWDFSRLEQAYKEETEEAVRLQYVAATRAAHALIIMPVVNVNSTPNAWFSDETYQYDSLDDINEWIRLREADTKAYTLQPATSLAAHRKYTVRDLETSKNSADVSKLSDCRLISIAPSKLEPAGVTGYIPANPGYIREERPEGNAFGTVMHRVYELICLRYGSLEKMSADEREKAMERIINQAILENNDDMRAEDKPEEFLKFLKAKMLDYFDRVIVPIMKEAEEIYPEYTFSFFVEDSEKAAFIERFGTFLMNAREKINFGDEPIWVNGQADLVVKKKDGAIKVYDYKSDAMNGKPAADFAKDLEDKYKGQLDLYKYAIGKSFKVTDVQTELIDLYR